ncbi:hypothetical protein [Candidatus Formimonas warabiya]|uniref:DUF2802 domain-containing protein n=1 Tax=Formimonas warabiya TaxID=1761012 RepID=A0A3G1KT90_FORW1|nr:hypothetical protein [Candidatus Formimonas warabiya]ATW25647.1 hypothetical protein DCMF_13530 [Candidatus Formimonas warabiya]
MPNLIHLLFGLSVMMALLFIGLIYCLSKFPWSQPDSGATPDPVEISHQKEKKGEISEEYETEEGTHFEQELDEIYRQLELREMRDAEKNLDQDSPKYSDIYQAFDAGQSITDMARSFGKTTGEIELILNLRGHLKQEEII